MSKPDAKPMPAQLKLEWKLTDEQKAQVLAEVQHYLLMDCYDFAVDVGGLMIRAGELAAGELSDFEEEW